MNEQKIINKQLRKNMLFNLIAFSIIFSIFGLIIYGLVNVTIYKSADGELLNNRNKYGIIRNFINPNFHDNRFNRFENININPRLIYVIRDEYGNIRNNGNLDAVLNSIDYDTTNALNNAVVITVISPSLDTVLPASNTQVVKVKIEYDQNYSGTVDYDNASAVKITLNYIQNLPENNQNE